MQTCPSEDLACFLPLGLVVLACFIPLALVIVSIAGLASLSRERYQEIFSTINRNRLAIVVVTLFLISVIIILPFLVNKFGMDINTSTWKFWLQTAAGNWSPDNFPPLMQDTTPANAGATKLPKILTPPEKYQFTLAASVAFWLNNGIIIVLIGLVWRLTSERRRAMDVAAAIVLRDSFARTAARELAEERFPKGERDKIVALFNDALAKGQTDLAKHLPNIDKDQGWNILKTIVSAARRSPR